MNQFVAGVFFLWVGVVLGAPGSNRLVTPEKVELLPSGKVRVTYRLPCKANDASRIVMSNDDSGDLVVAIGVVYSREERNCSPSKLKTFTDLVSPKDYGYADLESLAFEPMETDTYSKKLEDYVAKRVTKNLGGTSLQKLISKHAAQEMTVRIETLTCNGYPSWEGNNKAVGVCLVEAIDSKTGEEFKGHYAVIIADETEHPGNPRQWSVSLVSYQI